VMCAGRRWIVVERVNPLPSWVSFGGGQRGRETNSPKVMERTPAASMVSCSASLGRIVTVTYGPANYETISILSPGHPNMHLGTYNIFFLKKGTSLYVRLNGRK